MKLRIKNKTLKTIILTSIICFLISGTIGVVAITLSANDIMYTPSNSEWQVDNAEDAINELYDLGNNKLPESYNEGYNAGIIFADGRANTSSTNYKTGYNKGYNAGVSAGKPSKTQTVSSGCYVEEGGSTTFTMTFGSLTQITGISYLTNSSSKLAAKKISISGNVISITVENEWSYSISATFSVTAIGY